MPQNRYEFPGYVSKTNQDTPTHQVESGTLTVEGVAFTISVIRNAQYDFLPYLIAKIEDARGAKLWSFKDENFDGVGQLVQACDTIVIAFVGRGKEGKVERVKPLYQFIRPGQIDLRTMFGLKKAAADFLDRDYVRTALEDTIVKMDFQKAQEERTAIQVLEQVRRDEERKARVAKMLARGKIEVYTIDGRKRFGVPVLGDEWQSLDHGTHVVLVKELGGEPVESFQVTKERGKNPKKGFLIEVTAKQPEKAAAAVKVKPTRSVMIEKDGGLFEVSLYPSMDTIRLAKAQGLNGGAFAAVDSKSEKVEVFAVHHDGIKTIGRFVPFG